MKIDDATIITKREYLDFRKANMAAEKLNAQRITLADTLLKIIADTLDPGVIENSSALAKVAKKGKSAVAKITPETRKQ